MRLTQAQAHCTFLWGCHGGVTVPARGLAIGLPGVSGYHLFLLVRLLVFLILFTCFVHHISEYKAVSSFAPCWANCSVPSTGQGSHPWGVIPLPAHLGRSRTSPPPAAWKSTSFPQEFAPLLGAGRGWGGLWVMLGASVSPGILMAWVQTCIFPPSAQQQQWHLPPPCKRVLLGLLHLRAVVVHGHGKPCFLRLKQHVSWLSCVVQSPEDVTQLNQMPCVPHPLPWKGSAGARAGSAKWCVPGANVRFKLH